MSITYAVTPEPPPAEALAACKSMVPSSGRSRWSRRSRPHEAARGERAGAPGVTAAEAADAGLVPIALVAVTVKVYAVPLRREPIVQARVPVVEHLAPPGLAVAV